jgi:hypothetical protein
MTTPKLTKAQGDLLNAALVDMASRLRPITVRGLYYQAVISSALPFIQKDHDGERTFYRMVQGRVLRLRQAGAIDWDWVVDESRTSYTRARWSDPAAFAEIAPLYYDLDLWEGQAVRPLLLVEKAGQVPVYRSHAARHGVDVAACKGYGSATYIRGVAMTIGDWLATGQNVQVIVAADFDPSGCDWPRAAWVDVKQHLAAQVAPLLGIDLATGSDFALNDLLSDAGHGQLGWQRELVTAEDLEALGPAVALRAPNQKDPRTKAWLASNGFSADQETCVEMDAVSPVEARARLGRRYLSLFDGDIQDRLELQKIHRDAITEALAGLAGGDL